MNSTERQSVLSLKGIAKKYATKQSDISLYELIINQFLFEDQHTKSKKPKEEKEDK